jgi:serine/threonine protein kinase
VVTEASQATGALAGVVLDGSYRIERLLGEGGMGAVYHATQLRLDKPVAVKVMARALSAASDMLARFHREALVTSNLGHPNIVQVFDFSTTPTGEPYLVMEFLDGEDLERRLRRESRLSPPAMLHIVKQVAAALMATHGKGIVHRDLKPANIFLLKAAGASDFVKVLDFGISKVRSATTKLTRTVSIMGTPGYMSPEQAKGRIEDIDERTDQWALACIIWECLAGELPFQGESPLATLFQVANEPPPPLVPKVPGLRQQVEDVLLCALAKKKQDRFSNIGDFVVALEEAVTDAAQDALPVVPRSVHLLEAALDDGLVGKATRPTTFTHTTGEVTDDRAKARTRIWFGAAGGAIAILLMGAFLLLHSGPAPKPVGASSPPAAPVAAPPTEPEPTPAPPPPAAASADHDSAKPDQARPSAPVEPKPKRSRPARRRTVPRMIEDL